MRALIVSVIVTGCLTGVLFGQATPPPATSQPAASAQPAPPRERPESAQLELLARRLSAALTLDESQKSKFDAIVAAHKKERAGGQRQDQVRALADELRAAREANDRERVVELARQLREVRAGGTQQTEKFFDDVGGILRADQQPALTQFRERWSAERQRAGSGANRLERTVRRLEDELYLTDEQRPPFDALVETFRQRFASQTDARAAQDDEREKLLSALREARDSGDAVKVRDLEEQLSDRRDQDLGLLNEFLAELEPLLTDDQRVVLERFRDQNAVPGGDATDVRTVLRAARRVRLEPEQRERLREIERETIHAVRELPKGDEPARIALTTKTKESILVLLTDEQKADFEKHLSRGAARDDNARPDANPSPDSTPEKP